MIGSLFRLSSSFFSTSFLVIAYTIFSFNASAGPSELGENTSRILGAIDLRMIVNDNFYCAPNSRTFDTQYADSDHLLNVASADTVAIFVHGFVTSKSGGRLNLSEMVDRWRYHIDLLEESKTTTSYCVVTWDTEFGFDDKDQTLSKLLSAIGITISDNRLGKEKKRIIVMGHSAGGNYIKYSHIRSQEINAKIAPSIVKTFGGDIYDKNYYYRYITLSTPHLGTKVADNSQYTALFASIAASLLFGDEGLNAVAVPASKAYTRGAKQLKSINQNEMLYSLNKDFITHKSKPVILAFGSHSDSMVNYESATPYFTIPVNINVTHDDFLRPQENRAFATFLLDIYNGTIKGD